MKNFVRVRSRAEQKILTHDPNERGEMESRENESFKTVKTVKHNTSISWFILRTLVAFFFFLMVLKNYFI